MLVARTGARVMVTDTMSRRRALALKFGAEQAFDPRDAAFGNEVRTLTEGRGADLAIVAASARGIVEQAVACSRPGARILLFAQTSHQERVEVSGADVCMGERTLCGSYSASVDLQKESAELVFGKSLPLEELISHRLPLSQIREGMERAWHPDEVSLKIVMNPQRWAE